MRSLVSRVFVSFWAAILGFLLLAIALTAINFTANPNEPRAVARQAADVLGEQGVTGLKRWLADRNQRYPRQRTLVIDADGRDILGQSLPQRRFARQPELLPGGPLPRVDSAPGRPPLHGPAGPPMRGPMGSAIHASDGTSYVVLFDPPPRPGPFAPPFSVPVRMLLLALAVAVSGLVSFLLARSITRPLRDLQGAVRTLAEGRLESRTSPAVVARADEIGALARDFNMMAERLATLITARQQLLRDLSHELRSPLARLRMAVDLALQPGADAPRQLDRIEREGERLETLIAQILQYARYERDAATLDWRDVDVAEIVRQVVHDAEYESQCPPGRITLRIDDGLRPLRADPQVLHAAIDNVVRNALRHGGDGPIEIGLGAGGDGIEINVRDRGPGVPPADLERIFEPFYRVPRNEPGATPSGAGIGLAVAAKAMQLHCGSVVAENADGGGLRMTLRLPRST